MCQTALTGRRNSVPTASGEVRPVLTWHDLKHRTLKPASGGRRPVRCNFAYLSAHESGGHRTRPVPHKERPVTPRTAHITRAQGISRAVVFSAPRFQPPQRRALVAESAAAGGFIFFDEVSFSLVHSSAPKDLLHLSLVQIRVFSRSSRVWVSSMYPSLKVFDLMCQRHSI